MEVSALTYPNATARHGRSPLLRLQSDEHLIRLIRAGHDTAFETLLSRYETRLLSFCRHLLGSREDAEDVLQEVFAAAYNAIGADDRPINVRPWLYRIARNRSLNHLRRVQAIGVDSMDVLFAANGETTADRVNQREEFRLLVGDIHGLPESQRTALILRELDALSYDQIAEAMETTVSSVKSLLVRARVSLAETAEARLLSCVEVRTELGEIAEGLTERANPLVRRHLKSCERCRVFNKQLRKTNRALAALMPIGPVALWKAGLLSHFSSGAGSAAAGSSAAGTGSGVASAGGSVAGALAAKAGVGLAVAVFVAAGVDMSSGGGSSVTALEGGLASSVAIGRAAPAAASELSHAHSAVTTLTHRHGATSAHRRADAITAHATATATRSTKLAAVTDPSTPISSSGSISAGGVSTPTTGQGATTAAPGSTATGTAPAATTTTDTKSSPLGGSGGTAGANGGAVSAAAGAVGTVAATVGSGLDGSPSGSGQTGPTATTPTVTVPNLLSSLGTSR